MTTDRHFDTGECEIRPAVAIPGKERQPISSQDKHNMKQVSLITWPRWRLPLYTRDVVLVKDAHQRPGGNTLQYYILTKSNSGCLISYYPQTPQTMAQPTRSPSSSALYNSSSPPPKWPHRLPTASISLLSDPPCSHTYPPIPIPLISALPTNDHHHHHYHQRPRQTQRSSTRHTSRLPINSHHTSPVRHPGFMHGAITASRWRYLKWWWR